MDDSYIFVNATGVGMKPLEGQSVVPDKSYFRPELIVIDVPYSPLETKRVPLHLSYGQANQCLSNI